MEIVLVCGKCIIGRFLITISTYGSMEEVISSLAKLCSVLCTCFYYMNVILVPNKSL